MGMFGVAADRLRPDKSTPSLPERDERASYGSDFVIC